MNNDNLSNKASDLSVVAAFLATLRRDIIMAYRRIGDFISPLAFSLIVCSLFPMSVGPDPAQLAILAPGILWVVALLACLLSSDTLFRHDYDATPPSRGAQADKLGPIGHLHTIVGSADAVGVDPSKRSNGCDGRYSRLDVSYQRHWSGTDGGLLR